MSRPTPALRRAGLPVLLAALLLAGGCAQRPRLLYHWEGYEREVYAYLNADSSTAATQLGVLQAQAEKARAANAALPPGFRAHVGLLHLKLGNPDEARRALQAEKAAFAEAAPFMDFLLARMDGKPAGTAAAAPASAASATSGAKQP